MDNTQQKVTLTIIDHVNCHFGGLTRGQVARVIERTGIVDPSLFHTPAYKLGHIDAKESYFSEDGFSFTYSIPEVLDVLENEFKITDIELIDERDFGNIPDDLEIDEDFLIEESGYTLMEHQLNLVNTALRERIGIFDAATSAGKTLVCLAISKALDPYIKTVIVVPSEQLLNQTYDDYAKSKLSVGKLNSRIPVKKREEFIATHNHLIITNKLFANCKHLFTNEKFGIVTDECFHPSHELLSIKDGWKPVAEVKQGELIVGYNPETRRTVVEVVQRTVTKHFSGYLCHLSNMDRVNLLTTPNHETPIFRQNGTIRRIKMKDYKAGMIIPTSGEILGDDGLSDFERLQIAYEADGHQLRTNSDGTNVYRFMFRCERKIERLETILNNLEIPYKKSVNCRDDVSIVFNTRDTLKKNFNWYDKFKSGKANSEFIYEVGLWDGHIKSSGVIEWNHSDYDTIMQLQDIARLGGYQTTLVTNTQTRKDGSLIYRINFRKKNRLKLTDVKLKEVSYDGDVHCVTVPSGNVVTRLHGVVSISGNCHNFGEMYADVMRFDVPHYPIRLGLTGSFPYKNKLKARMIKNHTGGGILETVEPKELEEQGIVSSVNITLYKTIDKEIEELFYEMEKKRQYDWTIEQRYTLNNKARAVALVEFIKDLPKKNTLVLCHAQLGNAMAKLMDLPFIDKDATVEERAELFGQFSQKKDHLQLASFGTSATGISENDIFIVVMIDVGKDRTAILQSIGRGMRKSKHQDYVDIIDIYADMKYGKNHLRERKKIYKEKHYPYINGDIDIPVKN